MMRLGVELKMVLLSTCMVECRACRVYVLEFIVMVCLAITTYDPLGAGQVMNNWRVLHARAQVWLGFASTGFEGCGTGRRILLDPLDERVLSTYILEFLYESFRK